jgi:hypothetical protein
VIFSRGRGSTDRHGDSGGKHARGRRGRVEIDRSESLADDDMDEVRPFGPYDVTETPDDDHRRVDLGALRIPAVAEVEIQLQANQQGQVERVLLAHGDSRLQIGVFAAPRTEGIWDEVRQTLRASLVSGGAKPEEVDGEYGVEIRAKIKDGPGLTDVRHVGIDGPRWFVHGIYVGAAAVDPDRAGPLRDVLRNIVVDRGSHALPVSEALPLRLPPEAAAQLAAANEGQQER